MDYSRVFSKSFNFLSLTGAARFDSRADVEATLTDYLKLHNHRAPLRAVDGNTRIQALDERQQKLFAKRVDDRAGLDM
ncbi:MAG TPA: hypothetical protein VFG03_06880 [Telluria sp.]|nr:hypothetical protein [Telluria sp.]